MLTSPPPPPTYPPSALVASPRHDADLEAQLPYADPHHAADLEAQLPPPYKRTETSPPGAPPPPTYREVPLGPVVRMNDEQNTAMQLNRDALSQRKKRFMKFGILLFVGFVGVVVVSILGVKYGGGNQKGTWKESER